jgi:hypothetical protein
MAYLNFQTINILSSFFFGHARTSISLNRKTKLYCPQEVVQSAETMPNKAKVTSSNPHFPSCVDMSKKKRKKKKKDKTLLTTSDLLLFLQLYPLTLKSVN